MSDYKPKTEDVRSAWAWWRKPMLTKKDYFPNGESLFEVTDLELDRWLDEVKAEAWEKGRKSGFDMGLTIAEVVTGTKLPPYPDIEPNPYRKEQSDE